MELAGETISAETSVDETDVVFIDPKDAAVTEPGKWRRVAKASRS